MSQKTPDSFDERELEEALAEELDKVSPRRDLWTAIRNRLQLRPATPRRRWLVPALGSAAVLLLIAIITPLALLQLGDDDAISPNGFPRSTPTATTPVTVGTPPLPVSGDGAQVFLAGGCTACHTIDSLPQARGAIGPDLSRIGARGDAYVRESIIDPNAVIAEECPTGPCQPGLMPQLFGQRLSQEELDALVAYLLTLR